MTAETPTVYASEGGTRYHATLSCRALQAGRDIWDTDEWVLGWPVLHWVRDTTAIAALGAGKMPCHVCLPGQSAAWYRSSSENDFGHEPFEYDGVPICFRCFTVRGSFRDTVPWPCSTAVVLGLAERESGAQR